MSGMWLFMFGKQVDVSQGIHFQVKDCSAFSAYKMIVQGRISVKAVRPVKISDFPDTTPILSLLQCMHRIQIHTWNFKLLRKLSPRQNCPVLLAG